MLFESSGFGQETADEESAEQQRARVTAERFLLVLERRPRLGTALDNVFGFHVQNGTLEKLVDDLRKQSDQSEETQRGQKQMLLGLLEMRRGRDQQAVEYFQAAQALLPDDAYAAYYEGWAHQKLGNAREAAEAMELSLKRELPRTEFLEIGKQLGRIYQRLGRESDAGRVWELLSQRFPGDVRVLESVAKILSDEGDYTGALHRYEQLYEKGSNDYRHVQYGLQIAEMKQLLNLAEDALVDLEDLQLKLKPGSWLYDEVRSRIEKMFLDTNDREGLTKYYGKWVASNPEDLDARRRLARYLTLQGKIANAKEQYKQAIALAPTDQKLRQDFINALVSADSINEAVDQYSQVHELVPNDRDVIVRWGELVAANHSQPLEQRNQQAAKIWKKLVTDRDEDAESVCDYAERLRSIKFVDEAISNYERAIELEPQSPRFREYLGEYLLKLGRRDEAVSVWQGIAQGGRRAAENFVRLAEVFKTFQMPYRAVKAMEQACEMESGYEELLRFAEMLHEIRSYERAVAQLEKAREFTDTAEQRASLLAEEIRNYQSLGTLGAEVEKAEFDAESAPDENTLLRLAALQSAGRRYADAAVTTRRAVELFPDSIELLLSRAKATVESGQLQDAVETYRRLVKLDRRLRSSHLQQISNLQVRLGQYDEAISTAKELLNSGTATTQDYRDYANLCFRLGRDEQGLESLRQAVRKTPNDREALFALAENLASRFETKEAIDTYWQAFDRSKELFAKEDVVRQMAGLYERSGRFDTLVGRLDSKLNERESRQVALLIASSFDAVSDYGNARRRLEALLTRSPEDVEVLMRLVDLSQKMGEDNRALVFQRQLTQIAPSDQHQTRLVRLLYATGKDSEAEANAKRLISQKQSREQVLTLIDQSTSRGRLNQAYSLLTTLRKESGPEWEVMYRLALVQWLRGNRIDAADAAKALLNLTDDFAKPSTSDRFSFGADFPTLEVNVGLKKYQLTNYMHPTRFRHIELLRPLLGSSLEFSGNRTFSMPLPFYEQARTVAIAVQICNANVEGELPETIDRYLNALRQSAQGSDDVLAADCSAAFEVADWLVAQAAWDAEKIEAASRLARNEIENQLRYLQVWCEVNSAGGATKQEGLSDEEVASVQERLEELAGSSLVDAISIAGNVCETLRQRGKRELGIAIEKELVVDAKSDDERQAVIRLLAKNGNVTMFEQASQAFCRDAVGSELNQRIDQVISSISSLASSVYESDEFDVHVSSIIKFLVDLVELRYENLTGTQRQRIRGNSLHAASQSSRPHDPDATATWDSLALDVLHDLWIRANQVEAGEMLLGTLEATANDAVPSHALAMSKGYVCSWNGRDGDSLRAFEGALKIEPSCHLLRMLVSRLQYARGQRERALATIEQVQPLNMDMRRDQELAAFQLAIELGRRDRAEQAARELARLPIDSKTQQLILNEMSQRQIPGVEEFLSNMGGMSRAKVVPLATRMSNLYSAGKTEAAAELATQVLRSSQGISRTTQKKQERLRALSILSATDRLAPIISTAEIRLKAAPNSPVLIEEVANLYEAAGRSSEAATLRARIDTSSSVSVSLAKARDLARRGKHVDAVDVAIKLLKTNPDQLGSVYSYLRTSIKAAGRDKFSEGLLDIGLKRFGTRILSCAATILQAHVQSGVLDELGTRLFVAMLNEDVYLASTVIRSATSTRLSSDETQAIKDLYLRRLGTQELKYLAGGGPKGILVAFQTVASRWPELAHELAESAKTLHEETPSQTSRVLAATLATAVGDGKYGVQLADDLIADQTIPVDLCWQIGIVFHEQEEVRRHALSLYERVSSQQSATTDISASVESYRSKLLAEFDRNDEALAILMPWITKEFSGLGTGSSGYQYLRERSFLAELLESIRFPIEAAHVVERALKEDRIDTTNRSYKSLIASTRKSLTLRLSRLKESFGGQYDLTILERWLDMIAVSGPNGMSSFDDEMRLSVVGESLSSMRLESQLEETIQGLSELQLEKLLQKCKRIPLGGSQSGVVPLVVESLVLRKQKNEEGFLEAITEMLDRADDVDEDEMTVDEAWHWILAWLPIRQLFDQEHLTERAEKLLDIVLQGAELSGSQLQRLAIRAELNRLHAKYGRTEKAREELSAMLNQLAQAR